MPRLSSCDRIKAYDRRENDFDGHAGEEFL
jgi:hypothetical protein